MPNGREMEKIVIFLGRPLSSEVYAERERGRKKTLTSASWDFGLEKEPKKRCIYE